MRSSITTIKGIGKTLEKDFTRIQMSYVEDFKGMIPEVIFSKLEETNNLENHKTSKNYLYVIRMICYIANGGKDISKMKWAAFKD